VFAQQETKTTAHSKRQTRPPQQTSDYGRARDVPELREAKAT